MIGEDQVKCIPENAKAIRVKLKLVRRVKLPPQTEVLVTCKANQSIKDFSTRYAVAQSAENSRQYAEDGFVRVITHRAGLGNALITSHELACQMHHTLFQKGHE